MTEQPAQAKAAEETPQRTDVPEYYVSGVVTVTDGKDFQLIFTKRINTYPTGEEGESEPAVIVSMSRGTAADVHASLGNVLDQLVEPFGPINTPYLQKIGAEAASKGRKTAK